jgi:hypothetical protein
MTLPPPVPAPVKKQHRFSVWQLVLGSVSLLIYLIGILVLTGLLSSSQSHGTSLALNSQGIEFYLWAMVFFAVLVIPSILLPIRRLKGAESRPFFADSRIIWVGIGLLALWPGVVYLGNQLSTHSLPGVLSALLNIVAISLPILFWVILGSYRLKIRSNQRAWGVFNFSQIVTTSISTTIEAILFVVVVIAAGAWMSQQAEFLPYLSILQSQGTLTQQNLQSLLSEVLPLIQTPFLYAGIVIGLCLAIPMIEEFFKPLAVWLFVGKEITPSEGFSLGLICGAGFALVESLLMMSIATGDLWTSTVIGRAGTALLHITTAGISGWALARSWQDCKYIRMAAVYLGVIVLHGLWNFFAVLSGLNGLVFPIDSKLINTLMPISHWVLVGLAAVMATIVLLFNRHLRKESIPPVLPVTISES